jgi:hypothetical protein
MSSTERSTTERARKHIHLGTRLETAERVRRGEASAREAARSLGVPESEIQRWVQSGEKPVTLDEVVVPPEVRRLTRRAQRLVALISAAEREIRALTQRLAEGRGRVPQGAD